MSHKEREARARSSPPAADSDVEAPLRARIFKPGDVCKGGRYKIFDLIGAGGMGEVWEVFDEQAPDYERQWAAVKVLRSRLAFDDESMSRLEKEARALLRIKHPNLVRVYQADVDEEKNIFFYVMERLRGETLDTKIQRTGGLPLAEALRVTKEIADGAHMLHEMGIIHRDLKPDNVFVTNDGRVVVLDLGVAKFDPSRFPDRATLPTGPNMIVGTCAYMSPEQCLGERLDARSDVYALGLILYICLTGFHAAQGSRGGWKPQCYQDWAGWHLHNHPKPLPQVLPWLPKEVWSVVKSALAKDRADRPASAEHFSGELRGLLELLRRHELLDLGPPVTKRAATGVDALANATTEELLEGAHAAQGATPLSASPLFVPPVPVAAPRSEPPLPGAVTAGGTEIVRASPVSSLVPSPRTANGTEVMRVPSSRDGAGSVRPAAPAVEKPSSTGKPVTLDSARRRADVAHEGSSRRVAVAPPVSGTRERKEQTRWLVAVGAAGIVCGLGIAAVTVAISSGHRGADAEPRGAMPSANASNVSSAEPAAPSTSSVEPAAPSTSSAPSVPKPVATAATSLGRISGVPGSTAKPAMPKGSAPTASSMRPAAPFTIEPKPTSDRIRD